MDTVKNKSLTYTDIDKQFDEQFNRIPDSYYNFIVGKDGTKWENVASKLSDVKKFIHQIYSQAKAEQREEDARIIENIAETEGRSKEDKFYGTGEAEISYRGTVFVVCQMIAKTIRESK